jgi:hypothetical protein
MFWFSGCAHNRTGPVTRDCTLRERQPETRGRFKNLVRPEHVHTMAVHWVISGTAPSSVPDAATEMRLCHYKPGRRLNSSVADASMARLAPAVCEELRRAQAGAPPVVKC